QCHKRDGASVSQPHPSKGKDEHLDQISNRISAIRGNRVGQHQREVSAGQIRGIGGKPTPLSYLPLPHTQLLCEQDEQLRVLCFSPKTIFLAAVSVCACISCSSVPSFA